MSAFALVVAGGLVFASVASPPPEASSRLPVRRVVLYGNGVAFVERRGRVAGRAELRLSVKPSQVDDVLKSLVVLDLGRGRIGAVGYDTPTPAEAGLGEVGFRLEPSTSGDCGTGGLAAVLHQLQGAAVAAATADGVVAGRILTVEHRRTEGKDGPGVGVRLPGAGRGGRLSRASTWPASAPCASWTVTPGAISMRSPVRRRAPAPRRDDDRRLLRGTGERDLVVGYTVASPVWKTTYRAVLDAAGQPFVEGWAIVENVGSEDWRGVRLSLVSGSPQSFVQHLQQPFFRHRPVLPVPEGLRPEPQTIGLVRPWLSGPEESLDLGLEGGVPGGVEGGVPGGTVGGMVGGLPHVASADAPAEAATTTLSDLVAAGSGVEARARPVSVGDLFDYRVEDPVSVPRGRSALIPILQQRLWGERVSYWAESEADGERPLAALRLQQHLFPDARGRADHGLRWGRLRGGGAARPHPAGRRALRALRHGSRDLGRDADRGGTPAGLPGQGPGGDLRGPLPPHPARRPTRSRTSRTSGGWSTWSRHVHPAGISTKRVPGRRRRSGTFGASGSRSGRGRVLRCR